QHIRARDLNRKEIDIFAVELAGVARLIQMQLTASNRILNSRPFGPTVAEEVGRCEGFVFGLIMHVIAARAGEQQRTQDADQRPSRLEQASPLFRPNREGTRWSRLC